MRRPLASLTVLGAVALMGLAPASAHAVVFNVNSTADLPDANTGDSACATQPPVVCTLRAAVQQASELDGADTINLPAGDYQLTGAADEDNGATGDLDFRLPDTGQPQAFTIAGAGARTTRIIGTGGDRVIHIPDAQLTTTISGVTITGGAGVNQGGGILAFGNLTVTNAAVVGNRADAALDNNQGGGIFSNGVMTLSGVTISGNVARGLDNPQGGGVFDNGAPGNTLTNVTITGNDVTGTSVGGFPQGGGIFINSDTNGTTLRNVTIAGNTLTGTTQGAGIFINSDYTIANSIVFGNRANGGVVSNCGVNSIVHSLGNNLEEGTDCSLTAAGDRHNSNPLLGPLQNNGGPTDTLALLAGSPAIDGGLASQCPATDQRGTARPQGAACDIGAFEAGATAPPPPGLPAPVLGRAVNVHLISGTVLIAVPGGGARSARAGASQKGLHFEPLTGDRQIPVGSFLDTKRGVVGLTSASGRGSKTQDGKFSAGLFQVLQSRKKRDKGLTELRLKGSSFRSCTTKKRGKRAAAAKLSSRTLRKLKANAKGRFRTRGNRSAATVRGTIWLTADRCDGTLTKVTRGTVAVRDFRRKKTILVKAGKSYLARAKG